MADNSIYILGEVFEYNPFSPRDVARMDEAFLNLKARVELSEGDIPTIRANEPGAIGEFCAAIIDFLDDALGVGTARRVFGAETDALMCLDAYLDLLGGAEVVAERRAREVAARHAKYSAERAAAKWGEAAAI